MKKNLFMVAAVALLAMVSCNKENVSDGGSQGPSEIVEFVASLSEDDAASVDKKTTYDETNKKTKWINGDEISVNGVRFRTDEVSEDGLTARFVNVEDVDENFGVPFTAIYPYNETEGQAVLPSTQTVSDGTFADESVLAVAYSESGNTLSFKHVSSVIKFQVATEGVSELVFEAENIAGTVNVNADASYSVVSGSNIITVKPESGTFSTDATYYVSVLPTLGEDKVSFSIKTEGVTVKSGKVNFKRNKVMDAKSVEVKYVRLSPNSCWLFDGARFAVNMFNSSYNEWFDMKGSGKGYYQCVVPEYMSDATIIFCRMNPKNSENGWETRWNQTADLTMPSDANNCYRITENAWDKAGSWSTISYKTLYLKPNSNWIQSTPKFAAYLFKDGSNYEWLTMMDSDKDGIYECLNRSSYTNLIFVRLDADKNEASGKEEYNDWGAKWNQTKDLTVPTDSNNLYTINSGQWDNATGTWSSL